METTALCPAWTPSAHLALRRSVLEQRHGSGRSEMPSGGGAEGLGVWGAMRGLTVHLRYRRQLVYKESRTIILAGAVFGFQRLGKMRTIYCDHAMVPGELRRRAQRFQRSFMQEGINKFLFLAGDVGM